MKTAEEDARTTVALLCAKGSPQNEHLPTALVSLREGRRRQPRLLTK